jgi:hypothetical protein
MRTLTCHLDDITTEDIVDTVDKTHTPPFKFISPFLSTLLASQPN